MTVAINSTVFYTPNRQFRITADTRNNSYGIEEIIGNSHALVAKLPSLYRLEEWLTEHGFEMADLIQD